MPTRSCYLLIAGLLASATAHAETPSYTSVEITSPVSATGNVTASGINGQGDVTAMGSDTPFVRYNSGGVVVTLDGYMVGGINDFGKVAGATVVPFTGPQAVVWSKNGAVEELPSETLSLAVAVSNDGDVAGSVDNGHLNNAAVMWRFKPTLQIVQLGFLWTDPEDPGFATSTAVSINDLSHIAGSSTAGKGTTLNDAQEFGIHAFLYRGGKMQDLGALALAGDGSDDSEALGLNDLDEVVGTSTTAIPALNSLGAPCADCGVASHAFLWRAGKMQDLGNLAGLPGWNSLANSIDDRGEIVGWSDSNEGGQAEHRAFLYTQGKMLNLQSYIKDGDPGVRLTEAVGINCEGWIVANGYNIKTPDQSRVYLLVRQGAARPECLLPLL